MFQYEYVKSVSFINGINVDQFKRKLKKNIVKFVSLYEANDMVYILVTEELDEGELAMLNGIIDATVYTDEVDIENETHVIEPSIIYPVTSSNGYTRISTFRYPGSKYQTISKFVVKGWVSNGRTYNVKMQNYNTGDTIYESGILSNAVLNTMEITSGFSNIPETGEYVNVLVKMNGSVSGKKVYIEYVGVHLME